MSDAAAVPKAARRARATDVRLITQRNLLSRRILDEMGLRELEELIQRLREMGMPRDAALADRLAAIPLEELRPYRAAAE